MKRKFIAASATMAIALSLYSGVAVAGPAPALTNLQFIGVTDDTMTDWVNVSFNQQSVSTPLSGTYGFTANYVEGTPFMLGSFYEIRTYNNGLDITNNTWQAADTDYLSDSSNIVYGKILYRGFELTSVSSGNFTSKAQDYYPPNRAFYDTLFLTISPSTLTKSVIEQKPTISEKAHEAFQKSVLQQQENKLHKKLFITHVLPQQASSAN